MKIGYARVSTVDQDLQLQREKLVALGVDEARIYTDRGFSGKRMSRDGLRQALAAVREGDEFIVPSMDRLARNTSGALDIMRDLHEQGITFNVGGTIYDPTNPMAKLFLTLLAAVAEAEGGWISLRTAEAMKRPEVQKRIRNRPPRHSPTKDAKILRDYESKTADNTVVLLAADYSMSRASIYRALDRARIARASARAALTRESNRNHTEGGGKIRPLQ